MPKNVKEFVTNKLAIALVSIVFGALLIIMKEGALELIVRIFGALLVVYGCAFTIMYYTKKVGDSNIKVTWAIVAAIAGIYLIIRPAFFSSVVFFTIGIYLIACGLTGILDALNHRAKKIWLAALCYGIILAVLGFLILFVPNVALVLAGVGLIVYGVMEIVGGKLLK